MKGTWTDKDAERVHKQITTGKSLAAIAREMGRSQTTVRRMRDRGAELAHGLDSLREALSKATDATTVLRACAIAAYQCHRSGGTAAELGAIKQLRWSAWQRVMPANEIDRWHADLEG